MTQAPCTIPAITLQRVIPETNTRRQYSVAVGQDLFGTPVVVCRWGRIGQAGRMRTHVCRSMDAARTLAADVVARRRRRGYSSANDVARQPSSSTVRARRPSAGQTRRRAAPAKVKAATAQLTLFESETLRPSWQMGREPGRTPSCGPLAAAKVSQISTASPPDPPTSAPLVAPLMHLLGKPATAHERERMIEALISNPRMQGQLHRGRDFARR